MTDEEILAQLDSLTTRIERVIDSLHDAVRVSERAAQAMGNAANQMREAAGTMAMARR